MHYRERGNLYDFADRTQTESMLGCSAMASEVVNKMANLHPLLDPLVWGAMLGHVGRLQYIGIFLAVAQRDLFVAA